MKHLSVFEIEYYYHNVSHVYAAVTVYVGKTISART